MPVWPLGHLRRVTEKPFIDVAVGLPMPVVTKVGGHHLQQLLRDGTYA
jgi:hypothetical protein